MKNNLIFAIIATVICGNVTAQSNYSTYNVNDSGVTISQAIDSLYSQLTPADTNEGGRRQMVEFVDTYWGSRAAYNDSNTVNMFQQYLKGLTLDRQLKQSTTGNNCTGNYMGAWKCIGPDEASEQKLGRADAVCRSIRYKLYFTCYFWRGF